MLSACLCLCENRYIFFITYYKTGEEVLKYLFWRNRLDMMVSFNLNLSILGILDIKYINEHISMIKE